MAILYLFAFLAGLATMLSPCILPILPVVLAAGTSKGRLRPLGVACGLIVSFTLFTLTIASIVQFTGISANLFRYGASALIFCFGAIMIFPFLSSKFSDLTAKVAQVGQKLQETGSGRGFWGGFLLGIALGLVWTPCAGPILAAITALIATHALSLMAVSLTLTYVVGASIPVFLLIWGGNRVLQGSKWLSSHLERIRQFFGVLTVLVALAIAFHWDIVF